jgi:diguanylate cyclase (GGDEF)-like protein
VGLDRVNSDGEKRVIGKTVELEGIRKNGEYFPLELSLSTWDVDGRKQYGGILRDITERKEAEKKLQFMSYHDSLTGLYNRGYFDEEMARLDKSRQYPVSIIVCDMDDLKQINDTFGHNVGDIAIKGAAKILSSVFRSEDVVARIGGDEFAIIVPRYDINENSSIPKRLQKTIAAYNENKPEDGFHRPIALSFGHSLVLEGDSLIEGYKRADKHMYTVKAQKKEK